MKKYISLIVILFLTSCSSTMLTNKWKNPAHDNFKPKKVLIVGVTQSTTGRILYEEQLKNEFITRGIEASESALIFENSFKDSKQSEDEIESQIDKLLDLGFDTVLISAVKGVEEKISYDKNYPNSRYYLRRFGREYYLFQNIYFNHGYYDEYKIYNIETSIYNIKSDDKKSLVWVGSYDLVDPKETTKSVNKYVKVVVKALEQENLIPKKE